MIKKIFIGIVLLGLVGILVVGAVNRTADKTARAEIGDGQGRTEHSEMDAPQGQGNGSGQGRSAEVQSHDLVEIQGTATSISADEMRVETSGGEVVLVEGMPWAFAQEQGFTVQAGDALNVTGFYEDGEFKVAKLENLSSDQTVQLRDANGRPGWSGRGRRGSG